MRIYKSKNKENIFYQIYLTKEESERNEILDKIDKLKGKHNRISIFISGENDYLKIIEKVICLEVEKHKCL